MVFSIQEFFPIHSIINPFYSRNFTFITQEITNTLLKKFYLYYPRNYEHLTQEILPLLPKKLRTPYSRNLSVPSHHTSSKTIYDPSTVSDGLNMYIWGFRALQHLRSLAPVMNDDDNDGQMMFGDLGGPKASRHLSYRWRKTSKKPHPGNVSRPGIEPGPAAW